VGGSNISYSESKEIQGLTDIWSTGTLALFRQDSFCRGRWSNVILPQDGIRNLS